MGDESISPNAHFARAVAATDEMRAERPGRSSKRCAVEPGRSVAYAASVLFRTLRGVDQAPTTFGRAFSATWAEGRRTRARTTRHARAGEYNPHARQSSPRQARRRLVATRVHNHHPIAAPGDTESRGTDSCYGSKATTRTTPCCNRGRWVAPMAKLSPTQGPTTGSSRHASSAHQAPAHAVAKAPRSVTQT